VDDTKVQPETPVSEPSVWADIAAELRRIADDCMDLIGEPAPSHFGIDIQPHNADGPQRNSAKNRAATMACVDTAATVLLGQPGATYPVSGRSFHHGADGQRGPIDLKVYQSVADPNAVDPEEELARLRAENEQLRAAARQAHVHPTWPTESELKPWESAAPLADRIAESMEPITEEQGDPFDADSQAGRGSTW
jgi:hypothetical protein